MPRKDHALTALYVFADDFLHRHPRLAHWRRSPNDESPFSDAEVPTVELSQGVLGVATLKQTHRLIARNWRPAFPRLCSYAHWVARLHDLAPVPGALLVATAQPPPGAPAFSLVDAQPIPVCQPMRHGRVRLLRDEGAWFGRSSKSWFFGYKLHVLRPIVNAVPTPGNWHERDPVPALGLGVDGGIVLGDGSYRGAQAAADGAEADLLVLTRWDAPPRLQTLLVEPRRRVETTLSQLWHRVVDRTAARSWRGLWDAVQLKPIHHNSCERGFMGDWKWWSVDR